jgi:hydroxypyruvate reductase/glycerate 2-kinase
MDINYHKKAVLDIYNEALKAVGPYESVKSYTEKIRLVYTAGRYSRLLVAGFGKASCPMAKAMEEQFPDILEKGIVITKYGHAIRDDKETGGRSVLRVFEAGHPVPDENGLQATEEIIKLLKDADEKTLLVCLISGGGSALLISPYENISLKDKQKITGLLLKSGADINELNTVRKHISRIKGGRFAEIAYPATVISLIISDVIGDRLDVIASGPTSPDSTTYKDALRVIEKYKLMDKTPPPVLNVLQKGAEGLVSETPKEGNKIFDKVENLIISNNKKALEAARQKSESLGLEAKIVSSEMTGEAGEVGKELAQKAISIRSAGKLKRPCCLISGGETTVTVRGNGLGGRNMELGLAFAVEIEGVPGVTLLSAGTDGTDGPTDAAGAIVDGDTVKKAKALGVNPYEYLDNNDSYNFLKKIDELLITGPTGTNVMDIQILLVEK